MENEDVDVNLFDADGNTLDTPAPVEPVVEEVVEPVEAELPEKFRDKTVAEVVESYTNLEKEFGRKSNEVGELRKLTDEILRQQAAPAHVEPGYINESEVDEYDIFDNPQKVVDRAIDNNPRLRALEEKMLADSQRSSHDELIAAHSDADEVVASDEFLGWLQESPSRTKSFQEAHTGHDVSSATDLLTLFKATSGKAAEDARGVRDANAAQGLRNASVEKGRPSTTGKPIYQRTELIRLKVEQPRKYAEMRDDIRDAYQDGRVK